MKIGIFSEAEVDIIDYTSAVIEAIYQPQFSLSLIKHSIIWNLKKKQYKKFKQALKTLALYEKSLCNNLSAESVLAQYKDDYENIVVKVGEVAHLPQSYP